ncbi:MAG TPA: depupylase/deamidase Dop [Actinomycetes bacterium]|nr:depupylase/deamidase Dop [Actinomycetes bacterium]
MGIETEYGIAVPGDPHVNPVLISSQIVNGYATGEPGLSHARWDYEEENPLRDARGFTMAREVADASQLTDDDVGLANVILTNGARLYVDHAHPEYSSPEVTTPRDVLLWDKAGERVMAVAAVRAAQIPGALRINLYKNNTDNKGASYGTHENYLMKRSTPFPEIVRHLTPFFVSRQIICGQGRVGLGQQGNEPGFQISQRADFFEVEVGLETTLKRPIINTRDEPHADADKYRRLHVIVGDANLAEVAGLLKVGTTSLVLSMIEEGFLADDWSILRPVQELHDVSHDPSLTHTIELRDGRSVTALELQREYCDQAHKFVEDRFGSDADDHTTEILSRWVQVLDDLHDDPNRLVGQLDWVAKRQILEGYRSRDGLDWSDARLQLVDLQYSDVRPDKGLYHRLVASGRMERIVTDADADAAVHTPPEDTRAWFRGECVRRYGSHVAAASWDSVIFDVPGRVSLQRVPMLEPLRGTKHHVGELLDRCETASELVDALAG